MNAVQWQRVEALFHACVGLPHAQREDLLDRSCAGDHALRADVEAVLEASLRADGFIEDIVRLAADRIQSRSD